MIICQQILIQEWSSFSKQKLQETADVNSVKIFYTNWGVLTTRTLWGQFWTLPQTEPPTSAGRICGQWVCTACCSRRLPMRSQEDWCTQTPGSHTAECEVLEHSHLSLSPTLHVVPEHLSKEKVSVVHVSIFNSERHWLYICWWIKFFYAYVWLEETGFFVNVTVYEISYIFTAF